MTTLTLLFFLMAGGALLSVLMHAGGAKVPLWIPVLLLSLLAVFELLLPITHRVV